MFYAWLSNIFVFKAKSCGFFFMFYTSKSLIHCFAPATSATSNRIGNSPIALRCHHIRSFVSPGRSGRDFAWGESRSNYGRGHRSDIDCKSILCFIRKDNLIFECDEWVNYDKKNYAISSFHLSLKIDISRVIIP